MKSQSDALLRSALRQTKVESLPDEIKRQIMDQVYRQPSMTKPLVIKPLVATQTWLASGLIAVALVAIICLLEVNQKVTILPFMAWLDQPIFAILAVLCVTFFMLVALDKYLFEKWQNNELTT